MAPAIVNRLPIVSNLLNWFKGDEVTIDNYLFRIHHQASTFVIMIGILFIFLENHLDGQAIICQGADQYASSYCWIHGTAYVREHLQGKATGCFVDQSKIESEEDAPVTAYYLWIPFLLTFCFGFAKIPRSLWRNCLENGLIKNILGGQDDPAIICQNFQDFRMRYAKYHIYFGFCEFMNLVMVLLSMFMTDALLLNKFIPYGQEVLNYIWSVKHVGSEGQYLSHDPMCELFPTEVACYIRIGATTGAITRSNYLCILNNNIFNQKYFLILWLWWCALIAISVLGLVYRFARIMIPGLSRAILMRKVRAWRLENVELSGADCFVLDMLGDNITPPVMDQLLGDIAKRTVRSYDLDLPQYKNSTAPPAPSAMKIINQ
eukprot:GFUD01032472.1.p1 GENE.GFUD01032472.1~~GFUD01032472.1.p1  ORF type:complete len:376 (+),score=66.60 GFUD01032472.1:58-1185(+)